MHFFLHYPRFAALRDILFAVVAQELGIVWFNSSNSQKIQWFLHGVPKIEFQSNVRTFEAVQLYIMQSTRFTS